MLITAPLKPCEDVYSSQKFKTLKSVHMALLERGKEAEHRRVCTGRYGLCGKGTFPDVWSCFGRTTPPHRMLPRWPLGGARPGLEGDTFTVDPFGWVD